MPVNADDYAADVYPNRAVKRAKQETKTVNIISTFASESCAE